MKLKDILLVLFLLSTLAGCGRYTAGAWSSMTGDLGAAEARLEGMLAENPDDTVVRRRLGQVYFRDHKYAQSAEQFGEALKRGRIRPEEQITYGLALVGSGQSAQGLEVLNNFSYPEHYRIQQEVRAEVAKLDTSKEPQLLGIQLDKAWDRGVTIEEQERRPDRGEFRFGDSLP